MELVNIAGLIKDLDLVLTKCCKSNCFHIELASQSYENANGLPILNEENPYTVTLKRLISLASNLSIKLENTDFSTLEYHTMEDFENYVGQLEKSYTELNLKKQEVLHNISEHEQALKQIKHLEGLDANFDQIFSCTQVKVRVGKLPIDSYPKLEYYSDKTFFFFPFDNDNNYYWGMYFAPVSQIALVDDIFKYLYFERVRVPDFVKGTPQIATEEINNDLKIQREQLIEIESKLSTIKKDCEVTLIKAYAKLKLLNDKFELRKMVADVNGKFYMVGFVPQEKAAYFKTLFTDVLGVSVLIRPPDANLRLKKPTKLKNGFLSKPFSMLVEMYGLPSYDEFNPTAFVAISYTLMFGLMFGDLGQGFLIFMLGMFLLKVKKMPMGGILTRVGTSSMFFGFMYGSVFGFEKLLDPVYHALGWSGKPLEVFESTSLILLGAVALGAVLIVIAMVLNIILGFRRKDYEKAIFGCNGIAGLTFYLSVLVGGALSIVLKIKVFTIPYIICLIAIPVLLIFFRVPLSNYFKYKKFHVSDEKEGIGTFIAENFFELFEFMLSYASNTMSFLRIGGFILSHAGMMLVVMTLAEGVSAGVSPIIIVIGNAFVMAMEGLIVAIQVLRLEFYEIFSRFYEGDGKPFVPVGVNYNTELD